MPYSKAHKEKTKNSILASARTLFSAKGFDAVTVNDVMHHCGLTRGAFYAHFDSKAELYRQALEFSALNSELTKCKPEDVSSREWLTRLFDWYLSMDHIRGDTPCPLAFLVNDIVSRDKTTQATYTKIYKGMNRILHNYAQQESGISEDDILSATAMIIGAVAVSRTMSDDKLAKSILTSCRNQVRAMLKGI